MNIEEIIKYSQKLNLLYVEDDKSARDATKFILEEFFENIVVAEDGMDGLEKFKENDIDLIITDINMPRMNGIEMIEKIREIDKDMSILVFSAHDQSNFFMQSIKLGVEGYLLKPIDIEQFKIILRKIISKVKLTEEAVKNLNLLHQYQKATDESTIVSKTDLNGIITYVNDKFCEISGYSANELIGKSHDIVNHPDLPASLFKEVWRTIQNRKIWSGKVKNIKKNGDSYYVSTVISPIIDCHGDIIEYIRIRTDITDLELIKYQLENDLNILNKNFSEAYKISQEYQHAINESNIVSRTDIDGKITYVNKHFSNISGYSEDELLGKTHSLIRHPDNPDSLYEDLWTTISSAKVWHGQIKNKKKNGDTYYVDSTIVPILNDNEEIVEYLSIRYDVTEIVDFHKELENTQKEIIYKMGEVGETRSRETGNHVKRVAEYSKLLGTLIGLGDKEVNLLYVASPMHDIGKVGIPDSILKKPGKLNDSEWIIMKTHSEIGYNILKDSKKSILKVASIVAYEHHEKWDGSGYPNRLKEDNIHIYGRITAIADVFDALGSDRYYKKAWELDKILDYMINEKGKHFEPKLVDIFLDNLDDFLLIRDKFKDL